MMEGNIEDLLHGYKPLLELTFGDVSDVEPKFYDLLFDAMLVASEFMINDYGHKPADHYIGIVLGIKSGWDDEVRGVDYRHGDTVEKCFEIDLPDEIPLSDAFYEGLAKGAYHYLQKYNDCCPKLIVELLSIVTNTYVILDAALENLKIDINKSDAGGINQEGVIWPYMPKDAIDYGSLPLVR